VELTLQISGALVNFIMSNPHTQTQSPPRRTAKPPYWKLSGDGSANALFQNYSQQ